MIHNDVLRSLRYILGVGESALVDLVKLADPSFEIKADDFVAFLKKEDEPGYVLCPDAVMARLLDGVVFQKRGKDDARPQRPFEKTVGNNLVLKKLRVAYELKEVDLHAILGLAEFPVSKPELSALFRNPDHKNYRTCGDQLLRNFLRGLALRERGPSPATNAEAPGQPKAEAAAPSDSDDASDAASE